MQVYTTENRISWTCSNHCDGVCSNDGKVQAVKELPRSRTVKEAKGFLGLVNYYRKHLKNLPIVIWLMTALTRKKMPANQLD